MPWSGINRIKVTFNESVTVNQSDLLLTGINVPSYNVAGGTFSYDANTFTATWTLPLSIGADQLMLALNANGSNPIEDAAGNRLDGEWTNPTSTTQSSSSSYPSGSGTAGGNFTFRFNVLPGDANQDGLVNISDLTALASQWQQTSQGFLSADLNHDGQVNISDLTMLASNWQATLPAGTPAPGSFPAAAPQALAAATLPAQLALIQSDVPNVVHASAVAGTLSVNGLPSAVSSIPAVVTPGTRDLSSRLQDLATSQALPVVSRPTASAVHGIWKVDRAAVTLNGSGETVLKTSALPLGTAHRYSGDTNFTGSSGSLPRTINASMAITSVAVHTSDSSPASGINDAAIASLLAEWSQDDWDGSDSLCSALSA